jgi:hypothetical protein
LDIIKRRIRECSMFISVISRIESQSLGDVYIGKPLEGSDVEVSEAGGADGTYELSTRGGNIHGLKCNK